MSNNLSQATNGLLMQLVMDLKSGYEQKRNDPVSACPSVISVRTWM